MKVSSAPRYPYFHNGHWQSDFRVDHQGLSSRITVFANQPVSYTDDGRFELDPEEVAREMCYQPFRYHEVICHDLRDGTMLEEEIKDVLEKLNNLCANE